MGDIDGNQNTGEYDITRTFTGVLHRNGKQLFCILQNGVLCCYDDKKYSNLELLVDVTNLEIKVQTDTEFCLALPFPSSPIVFSTSSGESLHEWVMSIQRAIASKQANEDEGDIRRANLLKETTAELMRVKEMLQWQTKDREEKEDALKGEIDALRTIVETMSDYANPSGPGSPQLVSALQQCIKNLESEKRALQSKLDSAIKGWNEQDTESIPISRSQNSNSSVQADLLQYLLSEEKRKNLQLSRELADERTKRMRAERKLTVIRSSSPSLSLSGASPLRSGSPPLSVCTQGSRHSHSPFTPPGTPTHSVGPSESGHSNNHLSIPGQAVPHAQSYSYAWSSARSDYTSPNATPVVKTLPNPPVAVPPSENTLSSTNGISSVNSSTMSNDQSPTKSTTSQISKYPKPAATPPRNDTTKSRFSTPPPKNRSTQPAVRSSTPSTRPVTPSRATVRSATPGRTPTPSKPRASTPPSRTLIQTPSPSRIVTVNPTTNTTTTTTTRPVAKLPTRSSTQTSLSNKRSSGQISPQRQYY